MRPNQTPTVLVTLTLTPDQAGLLGEIQAEANDILDNTSNSASDYTQTDEQFLLLERGNIRIVIDWSISAFGDMLTLAIGEGSKGSLQADEARLAANMLRDLVRRAEALFDVKQSLWQITPLPLNRETMKLHATRWSGSDALTDKALTEQFYVFRPDETQSFETAPNGESETDIPTSMRNAMDKANEEPSWAMQASALTLSTACAIAIPPVGIAMFTYAVLRQGTDMLQFSGKETDPNNGN